MRGKTQRILSLGLYLAFLGANSYVAFQLVGIQFLFKVSLLLAGFSFLVLLLGVVLLIKNGALDLRKIGRETTSAVYSFKTAIKGKKKSFLTSLLSVGLVVALILQSMMISSAVQSEYLERTVKEGSLPSLVLNAVVPGYGPGDLGSEPIIVNNSLEVANRLDGTIRELSKDIGLPQIDRSFTVIKLGSFVTVDQNNVVYDSTILAIDEELMNLLWDMDKAVGELPRNNVSVFAVVYPFELPDVQPSWNVNKTVEIATYRGGFGGNVFRGPSVWFNVSGYYLEDKIGSASLLPYGIEEIASITYVIPLNLADLYRTYFHYEATEFLILSYFHDFEANVEPKQLANKLRSLAETLNNKGQDLIGEEKSYKYQKSEIPIYDELTDISNVIAKARILLLLFFGPLLIIGIFIASFVLGINSEKKKKDFLILKSRGFSSTQLALGLFLETIVLGIFSYGAGVVLAGVMTLLLERLSGLLLNSSIYLAWRNSAFLLKGLLISVIVALDLGIGSIRQLSKVDSSSRDFETREASIQPIWKIYFIDVFLLLLAVSGLIGVQLLSKGLDEEGRRELALNFSTPIMVILLTGATLTFYRTFEPMTKLLLRIIPRRLGEVNILGLKGLLTGKHITLLFVSVLMLSTSFGIVMLSVPEGATRNAVDQAYYQVGSEIRVSGLSEEWSATDFSFISQDIGVKTIAGGKYADIVVEYGGYEKFHLTVLGIDPQSYFEAAYLPGQFLGFSKEKAKDLLSEPENALYWGQDREFVNSSNSFQIELFDKFYTAKKNTYVFALKQSFDLWPLLIEERMPYPGMRLVVSLQKFEDIVSTIWKAQIAEMDVFSIAVSDSNRTASEVGSRLRVEFSSIGLPTVVTIDDVGLPRGDEAFLLGVSYVGIFGIYGLLVLIAVASIYYGSSFSRNRKREISLFKAIGMTRFQTIRMYLFQISYSSLIATLVGYVLGRQIAGLSASLIEASGFLENLPEIELILWNNQIRLFLISVFSVTVVSVFLPILRLFSQKYNILMEEK